MGDFRINCYLCDVEVIRRHAEDGTWPMFNLDETNHEHRAISVSTILADIHYKDEEDKTKPIGEMTIIELEDRIRRLASQEASMKLGSYLHAINGFMSKGFKEDFIRKNIIIDDEEYFITGRLDDKNEDTIIEAKFIASRPRLKKMRQYAIDQCDIYSWITELPKSRLFLHIIDEQKNEDESHLNNKERGGELVINYIKNNF